MSTHSPQIFSKKEKIKEVIYGLVTLLATNITLLLHVHDSTPFETFSIILGTTIGLWLACFFADILAQNITIINKQDRKHAHRHAFDASLGILIAGRIPIVFTAIAWIGWVTLKTAIVASIGAILIQLLLFSLLSLYRKKNNIWTNVITIVLQTLLFIAIIWLKIGH